MTCCAMRSVRRMRGTATTLHRRGRLCDINDGRLVILVVDVAHRREVYKRR